MKDCLILVFIGEVMSVRKRRGSLLLVITFGTLMAFVVLGLMTLATSLYSTSKDSAKVYADIQSYRAATELACYQYITDLESVVINKDLDADWISVTGNAVYSQALEAIKAALASEVDENVWYVSDITTALSGANLSNPVVLTDLLAKVVGVRQSFVLTVPEPFKLDWSDSDSWKNSRGANVALEPVIVEITLEVKGEQLFERFIVDGLYLNVVVSREEVGGSKHDVATMVLVERESGVSITRAQLETTSGSDDG